ncbi:hypothetical protein Hanom_Chr10g00964041 [Helianthus anomalus]
MEAENESDRTEQLGTTKLPEPNGYTRNLTQMERVYSIPDWYWGGYGISFKNFRRYGLGTGLGDT